MSGAEASGLDGGDAGVWERGKGGSATESAGGDTKGGEEAT